MRTTLPDEQGWYWCHHQESDHWCMAFVSTSLETIILFDGFEPSHDEITYQWSDFEGKDRHWYGPFHCPGTHFGQHTIVMEESLHRKASKSGEVIVVTYADFQHCKDEKHHSSVAIVGKCSREAAEAITLRETAGIGVESKLVRLCRELDAELDGVKIPASAAAVANGIRTLLDNLEDA